MSTKKRTAAKQTTASSNELHEFIELTIEQTSAEFNVTFGGESALHSKQMLSVGRYHVPDGSKDDGQLMPCWEQDGRAHFGLMTTETMRQLAHVMLVTADRADQLRALVNTPAAEKHYRDSYPALVG
ncbi:MAG: hypothetical protein IT355_20660 [Gemmatimonadaceae bacterium]|nr:hypothetical protein [Gemmatimonadaceae bacterium]